MKILRSILAIVVGVIVAVVLIWVAEAVNFIVYGPDPDKPFAERMETGQKLKENPQAMKAWIESMPTGAMVILQTAWSVGAFFGGGVAALIAGRRRLLHAAIIGGFVLAATVFNLFMMKAMCDYDHPVWLIALGVLLPIPLAMLAGKIVAAWLGDGEVTV
jgi:hypothetical protein